MSEEVMVNSNSQPHVSVMPAAVRGWWNVRLWAGGKPVHNDPFYAFTKPWAAWKARRVLRAHLRRLNVKTEGFMIVPRDLERK